MGQITSGLRAVLSNPFVYDTVQNIMGVQQIRRELVANFIRPSANSRILDIGCGTAEILRHLPNEVEYWGYDISREYIASARERFAGRGNFFVGELNQDEIRNLPKFDTVLAMGVLHHLDDSVAGNLFRLGREVLDSNGRMITIDPCLVAGQHPVARYLICRDRGQNVRDMEGYRDLATAVFNNVVGTLRHRSWIPYTHWIMECSA